MGTVLILTGVVCVIAAIVGGGVKLHNVEVGSIASLWRQILLGFVGVVLAIWGLVERGKGDAADDSSFNEFVGVNVSENAVDLNQATDANLAMDDDSGDPENIIDAPAPVETGDRSLWVKHDCTSNVVLYLVTFEGDAWNTHRGESWVIKPGGTYVSQDNARVRSGSKEIYFRARTENGSSSWEGNYSLESLNGLMKAELSVDSDGDYRLELDCSR